MKIITVNLPVPDIKTIALMVGNKGLYPSRSELIRVAIREFLIKELEIARNFPKFNEKLVTNTYIPEGDKKDELFVRIPMEKSVGMKTIKEYKTYKIVKK